MIKIIKVTTVPISMNILLKGQLKYLSQYFSVVAVSSPGKDLSEVCSREGVPVREIKMKRRISIFSDFISLIRLFILFRRERPHLVHSITPKAGLLSMLAAKLAKVPIRIHTFTGLIFPSRRGVMRRLLIFIDKVICWAATSVYPEGNGVRMSLIEFNITSKYLKVIANGNINGVDIDYFNPALISENSKRDLKLQYRILDGTFIYTFIGRIVGDKGINELVKAFCSLPFSNKKLFLIGTMEDKIDPLSSQTVSEISKNTDILLVPFQKDIRIYLSVSDVFVFPSLREGFPNVLLQAGAMELPCIVTDISGSNEIIEHYRNGIIIPPENHLELHKAMELVYKDNRLRTFLKSNCRSMITDRFEQKYVWNSIRLEYMKLVNDHLKSN